jgi:crotonobetainyl-CoA:carnitine CoA-transferase CaiB-like acyl-CoA transferase
MQPALQGLRVVEFSAGMAGPWIGRFMAHCGAEVIKVESRNHPDVTRLYVPPRSPEMGIQPQLSPWFTDWNAGKRFVALDLTQRAAVELARRLVAASDVVVENYSAGVMDKLGLGYAALSSAKPDLIMFSSSGYGDTGPYRHYVTWGPNIEALSGLSTLSGFPERDCTVTQYAYPDPLSALHGLFAIMSALDHRTRTGIGQYINMSQLEATVSAAGHTMMEYLASGRAPARLGNRSLHAAPHGCYACAGEDRWCVIVVADDAQWARFRLVVDDDALADTTFSTTAGRLAHAAALDEVIGRWTATRDPYAIVSALQDTGIAAGVVQTTEDQWERDAHLSARGFFESIDHLKKGMVVATGIPLGLTATPGRTAHAGEAIGRDNDYVFGQVLGLSDDERRRLTNAGAIESADPV